MLLLFCELFEKKGALDFQDILPLNLLSGGHQSTFLLRHKSIYRPDFKGSFFSDIDFTILITI